MGRGLSFGVNLLAYIRAEMGLGTAARGIAAALDSAAIPFNIINFEHGNPSRHRDRSWSHKEVASSSYDFTILVVNPDNIANATEQIQKKQVKDGYTIGYWFWELPELPDGWQFAFSLVNEVWAASRFIQDAISARSPVPVFRVPVPVALSPGGRASRKTFSLPDRRFLFLSMSDTQSQLTRKNPLGVIRAFRKAFPRDNKQVGLVLRINNVATAHDDREVITQIREEIKGCHNIYLLDAPMSRSEIDALLRVSDCFVSLHRSEGFGLGPAEAMCIGKPVILTNWSGNVDYMTPDNSVGIDYELVRVGQQYGPYRANQLWADPDLKQAAFWMKRLAMDPELAQRMGRLGQKTIKTHFSPKAVGKIIRKRLEYLWQTDPPRFQVFAPQEGRYAESRSDAEKFEPGRWQRVKMELRGGMGDGSAPLRIDPGNKVGILELAAVSLRSTETGQLIWRAKTAEALAELTVGGTAVQLRHDRLLRLLSFGEDPQILLPRLQGPEFDVSLVLEVWLRLQTDSSSIAVAVGELQPQITQSKHESALLRADLAERDASIEARTTELHTTETGRSAFEEDVRLLRASAEERQQQLENTARERNELRESLAAESRAQAQLKESRAKETQLKEALTRETELKELFARQSAEWHQLLIEAQTSLTEREKDLVAREHELASVLREGAEAGESRSRLQRDLEASESERRDLQQFLAERENEYLSLVKDVKTLTTRLDSMREKMSELRARRADATSRLKQREQLLHDIQSSAVWKVFKPIWKHKQRLRRTKANAKLTSKIAFAIDLPRTWACDVPRILIKGWCFYPSGEQVAGVRARIGGKSYFGSYGLERKDVVKTIGHEVISLESGFVINCPVPVGTSTLTLEAIVQGNDWQPFFEHQIKRELSLPSSRVGNGSAKGDRAVHAQLEPRPIKAQQALALLGPLFERHAKAAVAGAPRFSVITPTFNSRIPWVVEAARSLLSQTFSDWEWCIVDDGSTSAETRMLLEGLAQVSPRLRIAFAERGGISAATNGALGLAVGDYACFMDHDDLLDPSALESLRPKIEEGYDVIYSDEDKLDDATGQFVEPFFKPDWSPEYFRGVMYVGHLLTVRRAVAQKVGFDTTFDGVQDFEFMLRISETTGRIGHIPKILYHWRKVAGSVAEDIDAKPGLDLLQKKAVDAHLKRLGLPAEAIVHGGHRLRMKPFPKTNPPNISVIIPAKDAPDLIARCLASIYELTTYPRFQVTIVDNGTTDEAALAVMQRYPVQRLEFREVFNFSRANNLGSKHAPDGFLVFLNNDTEVLTPDWLEHLLYYAEQPDVGAAGPLLVYDNRTVQHAGVALGMRGTADHVMRGFPLGVDGYAGSLACAREVSAVTAACMMMSKRRFNEVGGFNEYFATAYQDVDLCLRLRDCGLRIIYTPQSVLVHHESVSRKSYYDMVDRMFLLDRWEAFIEAGDPYYSRHFDLERGDYSVALRR